MFQVNKFARHARGASITSQRQYYHHIDLFVRFIADHFNVRSLKNIAGKHLAAYIEDRQSEGKSAATVKNDLAAIRYFHDQMENTRYFLPNNKELHLKYGISLERRMFGGVNRRWDQKEFQDMIDIARKKGWNDIALILECGREAGLRIHEAIRLDRAAAEGAIRTNELVIKGKGGLIRHVPLRSRMVDVLQMAIQHVARGQKLFVPADKKGHETIQSVQGFIYRYREQVSQSNLRPKGINLTYHGLRHLYSYEEYQKFIKLGYEEKEARLKVSNLIGHSREDVTRIYLTESGEEDEGIRETPKGY